MSYRTRQRVRQKERYQETASPDQRRVDEYLKHVTLVRGEDAGKVEWVATIDDLPGCTARARTPQEALNRVSGAVAEWVTAALEEGRDIPEPRSMQPHSGRLLLRMPQTLHAELSRVAERESVSLNQFITDILAGALGWRVPAGNRRAATRAVRPTATDAGTEPDQPAEGEPVSAPPQRRSTRFFAAALVANVLLVAAAAVVAILVLIAAWR